jgi:uroporphyrinogen decarboxylase
MDSRERTFLALNHEEPDRVPIDFWASSGFRNKLSATLGVAESSFWDRHDVDLRYIAGPRYIGPPLRTYPDGSSADIWGVRRQPITVLADDGGETYQEVAESPLANATTVDEIEAYAGWPSPDDFDYHEIAAQCQAVRDQGRVAVFMGDRLNRLAQLKPAMYLRGVEQILLDLAWEPELAKAIFANIRRFYVEYAERVFEAADGKLDILLMGDDFGMQMGPLVSPAMWTEFLGDGFADYVRIAKAHDLRVMHHTCGAVRPIIPLMIERGLDVLQSLQPEAAGMEAHALKADFGDRLAFHGGISIQQTMPHGTPDDVRAQVRSRIDALAPGGGYILCTAHNVQADVSVENAVALLEAYRKYGRYD